MPASDTILTCLDPSCEGKGGQEHWTGDECEDEDKGKGEQRNGKEENEDENESEG